MLGVYVNMRDNTNLNIRLLEYYIRLSRLYNEVITDTSDENTIKNYELQLAEKVNFEVPHNKIPVDYIIQNEGDFFILEYVSISKLCDNADVSDENKLCLAQCWEKLGEILKKEKEWEKNTYQFLQQIAESHPLIAKFLIAGLSSILVGLLSNCIYEGITSQPECTVISSEHTEDCQEFGKEVRIMEDGNGYQIEYFTEQGKEVEGYISKEDMKIICDINKDKKVEK